MDRSDSIPARFQAALERLDGNSQLLCEMAAITSEDLPQVTRATEAAIQQGDCDAAASGLHKLKGMLSTFDADSVTLEIQETLDAARRGQIAEVRVRYLEQKPEIDRLIGEITTLASSSTT